MAGNSQNIARGKAVDFLIARGVAESIYQWSDEDVSRLLRDINRERILSLEAKEANAEYAREHF